MIYIDESYDERYFVYSAIFVNAAIWNRLLARVNDWRSDWQNRYQIPIESEIHSTKIVRGESFPSQNRSKEFRAEIFHEGLGKIESLQDIRIMNAITKEKRNKDKLFRCLVSSINNSLRALNAYGLLICDEGDNKNLTSISRSMKKMNSFFEKDGSYTDNQTDNKNDDEFIIDRLLEDPLFKTSHSSYFIQIADMVAFSLLRNENPIESTQELVRTAFSQLDTVLIKPDSDSDSSKNGIIRL